MSDSGFHLPKSTTASMLKDEFDHHLKRTQTYNLAPGGNVRTYRGDIKEAL